MAETSVIFPDVEALLTTYLSTALGPDVWVGIQKPTVMTNRKVVIVRCDGGPQTGRVTWAALIAVRAFAPDDGACNDLAALTQSLIYALADTDDSGVSHVDVLTGRTALVDESLIPCRYIVCQLIIRGT